MSRKWLIVVSVATHVLLAAVLVISGLWRLDRVEAAPAHRLELIQPAPPAAAGGAANAAKVTFTPKRVVHETHQPTKKPPEDETPVTSQATGGTGTGAGAGSGSATQGGETCSENCTDSGPPAAPVCGNGSLETGEECDDGNTVNGDGCSASCRREPTPLKMLPPAVLQGLRISGETQVHPDEMTQLRIRRDGVGEVRGTLLVCVGASGRVASARMAVTTKYPDYDAALLSAARDWQYRPYMANGVAIPACSTVTFVYTTR